MVTSDDLKTITMFSLLSQSMLDRTAPLVRVHEYGPDDTVFDEGAVADSLYMLVRGKVLLNMEASPTVSISVMAVEPGDCFGWSALLGRSYYSASAVCNGPAVLWSIRGRDLLVRLYNDHTMGFRVMEYVARAMNDRLEKRTGQLFKTLLEHLDLAGGG